MIKAYLDTNVIFDLLLEREPYVRETQALFRAFEANKAKAYVCALSFPNLHYLLRKKFGNPESVKALKNLSALVSILPVDGKTIALALESGFGDFEDAVQYFAALEGGMTSILTRDLKGFKKSKIQVYTPGEFLGMLASS